jgi:hypothetical protein
MNERAEPNGLGSAAWAAGGAPGLVDSVRPGVPYPDTVMVARMTDDSDVLCSQSGHPAAVVAAQDAGPLRAALADAFGDPVRPAGGMPCTGCVARVPLLGFSIVDDAAGPTTAGDVPVWPARETP